MPCKTISAFTKYLKLFKDKDLCRIHGKNVSVAEKEIVAVCLQLNEVVPYLLKQ